MNEVIIIQIGYSKGDEADCSITLVKSPNSGNILIDTGSPHKSHDLIKALEKVKLELSDVNTVIGTHGHVDHIGNLNLFPNAKFFVGYDACKHGIYEEINLNTNNYKLSPTIDIVATPGHTCSDISIVVRDTKLGTVAIVGDLFENERDLLDESLWISKSFDPEIQSKNRNKIIELADYIIPGHGKMFGVSGVL